MKTKKDKFEPVGAERMTDAELSKQLGSYQRAESIGMLLGVLLVIAGCIMMFVYRNIAVICILVFAGVALFLLVAKPAQTKKKALMQQQLGGFFRTELTKAFGPEPEPATLPIDWAYLTAAKLSAGISRVTTLPAPITVLSPITTPARIVEPAPIHTLLPIVMGFATSTPAFRISGSIACSAVVKQQFGATKTWSPKVTFAPSVITMPWFE